MSVTTASGPSAETLDQRPSIVTDGHLVQATPSGSAYEELPYEARLQRLLGPLHRSFNTLNRWFVLPAFRVGLGPLFSTPVAGSVMILRTTGRRSGLRREAPLGYVVQDGAVYVCAGFGQRTAWYRNLVAEPRVEVVLPTIAFAGRAETVLDEAEWDRAFPAYLDAIGLVGRALLGDVARASAERKAQLRTRLPLIRIRPTGIAAGPADPGGGMWLVVQLAWLIGLVALARRVVRRRPSS
jgi:deazaflavin-dependent oxidoreductase (nitroreductase family)